MKILVIGGSASGKSQFAESIIEKFNTKKYYVATMEPYDSECDERILKHRNQRGHIDIETIEKYRDIGNIDIEKNSSVIIECMGNLVANEIYGKNPVKNIEKHIVDGINAISRKCKNIVVVSNDVFMEGIENYSEETIKYMKILSDINRSLSHDFDFVTEVVCGIPIHIKGDLK